MTTNEWHLEKTSVKICSNVLFTSLFDLISIFLAFTTMDSKKRKEKETQTKQGMKTLEENQILGGKYQLVLNTMQFTGVLGHFVFVFCLRMS